MRLEAGFPTCTLTTGRVSVSFLKYIYIYFDLFLAALGLRCCAQAFSSCGKRGLLFIVVHGLLIAVTSLVEEHRL